MPNNRSTKNPTPIYKVGFLLSSLSLAFSFNVAMDSTEASATCVTTAQSIATAQTAPVVLNETATATALDGATVNSTPVVVQDTCGGDDVSYQVALPTAINFQGGTYTAVYATTNSTIVFGRQDNDYANFPRTTSISVNAYDWVVLDPNNSGSNGYPNQWKAADEHLIITSSQAGFQVDLAVRPYGANANGTPLSTIVVTAAINEDSTLTITYLSDVQQGLNTRTGVRLPNGTVVSLADAGLTRVYIAPVVTAEAVQPAPTPSPSIVPTPEPTPSPTVTPEPSPTPQPSSTPTPTPTPSQTPTPQPSPTQPAIPTPTPSPTPSPSPSNEPSPTPSPSATPEVFPLPTSSPTPEPAPQPSSNPAPTPSVPPVVPPPAPQPEPTTTPSLPQPSVTPSPSVEPTPPPAIEPSPEPTPIPEPLPVVEPLPIPVQEPPAVQEPAPPIEEPTPIEEPAPPLPAEPMPEPAPQEPVPAPEPPIVEPPSDTTPVEPPVEEPAPPVAPEPPTPIEVAPPVEEVVPVVEQPKEVTADTWIPPVAPEKYLTKDEIKAYEAVGIVPNNAAQLPTDIPKLPDPQDLKPAVQQDVKGVENGGIQFFGTQSQPQVINEDGQLTPPPPAPGSGDYLDPEAITLAETFIGQVGGMTFNSPDVAVIVELVAVEVPAILDAIPSVGEAVQAVNAAYVALANIGNDMSPVTRKKAKKVLVATIIAGPLFRRKFGS
jgi:hypothetical protein